MYYLQSERRALFLVCYSSEYDRAVQKQRDFFSFERTKVHYRENEIDSSIRAHADQIHATATARARWSCEKLMKKRADVDELTAGHDLEAVAADFANRTDGMRDEEARQRVVANSAPFIAVLDA